jgi:transposase
MVIIGCDFHPSVQQVALLDTETGRRSEGRLTHEGEQVRRFYAELPRPVRIGIECSGYSLWFEEMLEELGIE